METSQALDKLRQICSRQEKCPADVVGLLKRWDIDDAFHQNILTQLKAEKFVDEYRYASAFVKDKIRFEHWGTIKIRFMLRQKGIDSRLAEKAMGEVDREEYRQMVGKELSKKRKSLKGTSREIWAKLARYGSSRGYEMDIMRDFLGDVAGDY
jgi:regulatory protein